MFRRIIPSLATLLLGIALSAAGNAAAGEVIHNFFSHVRIGEDRKLRVTEEITVTVAGDQIKRGIFRDFPLREEGSSDRINFAVESVTLDGSPLKYEVDRSPARVRVTMGDRDKLLPHGVHTFSLVYDTDPHVFPFDGYDELNWNVTGGEWAFPIEAVSCRITVPEGERITNTIGWLGPKGTRDSPLETQVDDGGESALFTGNKTVRPGEHFTVAVAFAPDAGPPPAPEPAPGPTPNGGKRDKRAEVPGQAKKSGFLSGIVADNVDGGTQGETNGTGEPGGRPTTPDPNEIIPPSPQPAPSPIREEPAPAPEPEPEPPYTPGWWDRLVHSLYRSMPGRILLDILSLVRNPAVWLTLAYHLVVWWLYGRDLKPGVIIPQFHPPTREGSDAPMSPAAIEYVVNASKPSNRGFSSLFISLAVKGLCRIQEKGKEFTLLALPAGDQPAPLAPEERSMYDALSSKTKDGKPLTMSDANRDLFRSLESSVKSALKDGYAPLWRHNRRLVLVGWLVVTPLALLFMIWRYRHLIEPEQIIPWTIAFAVSFYIVFRIVRGVQNIIRTGRWGSHIVSIAVFAVFLYLSGATAVWVLIVGLIGYFSTGLHLSIPFGAVLVIPLIFAKLMKAPSREGRDLLDRIEGLRMYIEAAEEDRLLHFNPPEKTPEVFERFLPYAVALGLEKTWCDRFAAVLAGGLAPGSQNLPSSTYDKGGMPRFIRTFESRAATARTTPRSYASGGGSVFSSGGSRGGGGGGRGGGGGGGF